MGVSKGASLLSVDNSSTAALTADATFTGVAEDVLGYGSVTISSLSDQNGNLYVDFSTDGTNWDSTLTFEVTGSSNEVHRLTITRRYIRVRYTNGSVNQTYLRLQTIYGPFAPLTSGLSSLIQQDADSLVVRPLDPQFTLSAQYFAGWKVVNKFGNNVDVDGAEDIWSAGGDYTGFPTGSPETLQILSSSANDTSAGTGARTVSIYGLDANYNLQQEDITLNGTTPVNSVNTYMRSHRAQVLTSGSNQTNIGTLTIRHTTTTSNIFLTILPGISQTETSSYTIPNGHTGYLFRYDADLLDNTANFATIALKLRDFNSNTFRLTRQTAISTEHDTTKSIYGGIELLAKTDLVFRCLSVANANANISCTWDMLLVED